MLNSEKDWLRARRINRAWIGVGLMLVASFVLLGSIPALNMPEVVLYAGSGILGASLLGEFWTYRKLTDAPPDSEIARIERGSPGLRFVGGMATWTMLACFVAAQSVELGGLWFWLLSCTGLVCLVLSVALLPDLLRLLRVSRIAPELHDERAEHNLNRAYRQSFLVMFQLCILGGLVLMSGIIAIPADVALIGVGIIGMMCLTTLSCWYDWRDSR